MVVRSVALAVATLLGTGTAAGQSAEPSAPAAPEDPARMQRARERFEAGLGHYEAGRYRDAIHDFELSSSLIPSADLAFNIARCYEHLREYEPAVEYFERYLREKVEPPDRPQVEEKITELRRLIELSRQARRERLGWGLVRVDAGSAGVRVRVDNGPSATTPLSAPLRVSRTSRLEAEAPGMQRFVARVGARPGEVATAIVRLQPARRYRTERGRRLWTYVVGGLAVATAGLGVAVGIQAANAAGDVDMTMDYDTVRQKADTADMLFGGAIALGLGGVLLYFIEGNATETREVAAPPRQGAEPR